MAGTPTIAASIRALIQFNLVVMRYLGDAKDALEQCNDIIVELSDIQDLLYRLKDRANSAGSEESWLVGAKQLTVPNGPLAQFKLSLEQIEQYILPSASLTRYFKKEAVEYILPKVERVKTLFVLALQATKQDILNDQASVLIIEDIEPSQRYINQAEICQKSEIAACLFPSDVLSDCRQILSGRQEGTLKWILDTEKFRQWLVGTLKGLYLLGPPGVGKTVLASVIINHIQETFNYPDVGLAYVFCNFRKERDQTAIDIFASLLMQLASQQSAAPTSAQLHLGHANHQRRPPLENYLDALWMEVHRFSKVFIIIDALDECTEGERLLAQLQKMSIRIHLLVTARNISKYDNANRLHILARDEDIILYVRARIEKESNLARHVENDPFHPALQEDILHTVVDKSSGMYVTGTDTSLTWRDSCLLKILPRFLLARLQMDLLTRQNSRRLVRRALKYLPEELDEAYDGAIRSLKDQDHQLAEQAERILHWIVYARRPLTVKEVQCAIAVEPGDVEMDEDGLLPEDVMISGCAGLLTVDVGRHTIDFIHETAYDYFKRFGEKHFPMAQAEIARTCLTLLLFDEFAKGVYRSHDAMTLRLKKYPLLDYAAKYWGHHVRGDLEEEHTTQAMVKSFFKQSSKMSSSLQVMHWNANFSPQNHPRDSSALHIAAYFGLARVTRIILAQGADINARDYQSMTPLHWASKQNRAEAIQLLLDEGADINSRSNKGETALHIAAAFGQQNALQLLLDRGADMEIRNSRGGASLHVAVGAPREESTILSLLHMGADINAKTSQAKNTALHLTVKLHRQKVLKLLLDKGAYTEAENRQRNVPLQDAVLHDNYEAMSLLLDNGADIEAGSIFVKRALHMAAEKGNLATLNLLLARGADINGKSQGLAPLHAERESSSARVAATLLDKGANIHEKSSGEWTPIQYAAACGNGALFELYLERGADIKVKTPAGETLLHLTAQCAKDSNVILRVLLNRGLDVNAKSDQGWTPLHQAAWRGQKGAVPWSSSDHNLGTEDLLKVLLEQGADVNAASPTGEMPLHLATRTPYALNSSVSLLINRGACVDAKSDGGWTPLHLAAQQGYEEIFYALLHGGADVEVKNLSGHTPLDLAEKSPSAAAWFERGKILERVSVMGRKLNKSNACGGDLEPRKRDMVIVSTAAPR